MAAKSEHNIQALSLIQASQNKGVYIFRNQVGTFYTRSGQPVKVGVVGSADAIGFCCMEVTQEMVGRTVPIFFGAEYKTAKGRQREEQKQWEQHITSFGAPYRLIRSPEEMQIYIDDIKNGFFHK
jgi:hypothetical protein